MSQHSQQSLSTLGGIKIKENEYNSHASLSWIDHFIDIIYVGAVYSIGQLFEQCGTNHKVFFMAASYLGIMFTTRYQFDQYASTFVSHKRVQSHEFSRIIFMILYCMAIYSMTLNIAFDKANEIDDSTGHFGECVRNQIYDNGFAASFLISRGAIILLYLVKFFHDDYAKNDEFKALFFRKLIPMVAASIIMTIIFADVSPVIVFSCVAFVEFFSEYMGEALLKLTESEKAPVIPDSEHIQERLGEFFMLILGETMVGTLFVFYSTAKIKRTYGTCMSAFVLVTSIGMQFFERAQADIDADGNMYGDTYDENVDDKSRQSDYVDPAVVSTIHSQVVSMNMSHGVSQDHGALSTDPHGNNKWNHHPLHHKNKFFYATYVALHAIISFFMLIATTAVIEIYYSIENYNPHCEHHDDDDAESYHHYYTLKAQVIGGLVGVWTCMLLMELLQPEFYNSLMADWKNSKIVDQKYSKVLFVVKILVMGAHVLLMAQSENPDKGNYFIFYNAVIASIPSLCDISKIVYEYLNNVVKKRKDAASEAFKKKLLEEAANKV